MQGDPSVHSPLTVFTPDCCQQRASHSLLQSMYDNHKNCFTNLGLFNTVKSICIILIVYDTWFHSRLCPLPVETGLTRLLTRPWVHVALYLVLVVEEN